MKIITLIVLPVGSVIASTGLVLLGKAILGAFSVSWFPTSYIATATLTAGVFSWMAVGAVIGLIASYLLIKTGVPGAIIGAFAAVWLKEISFYLIAQLFAAGAVGALAIGISFLLIKYATTQKTEYVCSQCGHTNKVIK